MFKYSLESVSDPITYSHLFHISIKNMHGKVLKPRIPDNEYVKWGIEDGTTPRVSVSRTVKGCVRGIGRFQVGQELIVHEVDLSYQGDIDGNLVQPTRKQVPDCHLTGELWITIPVRLKALFKIKITAAGDTYTFKAIKSDGGIYEGFIREKEFERVKSPAEEIAVIFSKIKYGLRDPKTNKPWRDTHTSTSASDYDNNWKLAKPSETIKAGVGNCYDTVAISKELLTKARVPFKILFLCPQGFNFDGPTHTTVIYKDELTGSWEWLEGSWKILKTKAETSVTKFRSSSLVSDPKRSAAWFASVMASKEQTPIEIRELSGYPKYGCSIQEFEEFCLNHKVSQVVKPY